MIVSPLGPRPSSCFKLGHIQAVAEVGQGVHIRVDVHLVLPLEHINRLMGVLDGLAHPPQRIVAVHLVGIDVIQIDVVRRHGVSDELYEAVAYGYGLLDFTGLIVRRGQISHRP